MILIKPYCPPKVQGMNSPRLIVYLLESLSELLQQHEAGKLTCVSGRPIKLYDAHIQ